ncbi:MAG: phosphoribosylanthranilate isomerase [Sporolactobacillus sp.]
MQPMLKFCGNHSFEDLKKTIASRADYIGMIFTEKSRRTVTGEQAANWLKRLAPHQKKLVGVFADDTLDQIQRVLRQVPLDVLQFHGGESPQFLSRVKAITRRSVWKAIHHRPDAREEMRAFTGIADGFVIDTKVSGQLGGTGISFDWAAIPGYQAEAARQKALCFIAGGVMPENIGSLLRYQPAGIDISSGIERNFHKDRTLILKIEEKVLKQDDQATPAGEEIQNG